MISDAVNIQTNHVICVWSSSSFGAIVAVAIAVGQSKLVEVDNIFILHSHIKSCVNFFRNTYTTHMKMEYKMTFAGSIVAFRFVCK